METALSPLLKNAKIAKKGMRSIAKKIIKNHAQEIINLIKFGQLEQGIDGTGKIVGTYALTTQGYADADGVTTPKDFGSPYNFHWSGQTIENLKLGRITNDYFEITTIKFKQDLLSDLFGGELFELTAEHNNYVNEEIIVPNLEKYILETIFS